MPYKKWKCSKCKKEFDAEQEAKNHEELCCEACNSSGNYSFQDKPKEKHLLDLQKRIPKSRCQCYNFIEDKGRTVILQCKECNRLWPFKLGGRRDKQCNQWGSYDTNYSWERGESIIEEY